MSETDQSDHLKEQRILDRLTTREHMQQMVDAGEILKDSHVVREGLLDQSDIEKIRTYLVGGVPITENNYRLIDHLGIVTSLSSRIADRLKESNPDLYGDINVYDVEAAALLHDDGKRTSFKWYHNEIAGDIVAEKIGIKQPILDNMPNAKYDIAFMNTIEGQYTDADVERYIESLSIEKRIIMIADILGKREVKTWGLQPFKDVMDYHYSSRGAVIDKVSATATDKHKYLKTYASERKITPDLIDFSGLVYERLFKWLVDEGIDPDMLQQQFIESENNSSVSALVVDIGGVVIRNPDKQIHEAIESKTGLTWDIIEPVWSKYSLMLQTGKMNEAEFIAVLNSELGTNAITHDILSDWHAEFDDEVVALLRTYKESGQYRLIALTDTIPPHEEVLRKAGVADLFDRFIASTHTGVTKKSSKIPFHIASIYEWLPPQACIFIDDIAANVENAREAHMKGVQFLSAAQTEEEIKRITT